MPEPQFDAAVARVGFLGALGIDRLEFAEAGDGAADGDILLFVGYGGGATFTNIDATHWQVNYNGSVDHDVITFSSAAAMRGSDFSFI